MTVQDMAFVAVSASPVRFNQRTGLPCSARRARAPLARTRRRAPQLCATEPPPSAEAEATPSAPESTPAPAPSASSPASPPVAAPAADETIGTEVPFEIRGFSLANVFLGAGLVVTVLSFASYFSSNGTNSATSLGFVYGVPIALIGCALKYAELAPVPLRSDNAAAALREKFANATQRKIIQDITRHRYGDEAHLSAALSALGLVARGMPCPRLVGASEARMSDGRYCLALDFVSANVPYAAWEERGKKYETFFGPDIAAETEKIDADKRLVQLRLISTQRDDS